MPPFTIQCLLCTLCKKTFPTNNFCNGCVTGTDTAGWGDDIKRFWKGIQLFHYFIREDKYECDDFTIECKETARRSVLSDCGVHVVVFISGALPAAPPPHHQSFIQRWMPIWESFQVNISHKSQRHFHTAHDFEMSVRVHISTDHNLIHFITRFDISGIKVVSLMHARMDLSPVPNGIHCYSPATIISEFM